MKKEFCTEAPQEICTAGGSYLLAIFDTTIRIKQMSYLGFRLKMNKNMKYNTQGNERMWSVHFQQSQDSRVPVRYTA